MLLCDKVEIVRNVQVSDYLCVIRWDLDNAFHRILITSIKTYLLKGLETLACSTDIEPRDLASYGPHKNMKEH